MVRGVEDVEYRTPSDLLEIDNDDDNALRLMVIVPWELPGSWEYWRGLFPEGPVRITAEKRRTVYDGASRRLREPVRRRLLDPAHRRHYVYRDLAPVFIREKNRTSRGRPPFYAFAWDILEVETVETVGTTGMEGMEGTPNAGDAAAGEKAAGEKRPSARVLIALHLILRVPTSPNAFTWVRNLTREPAGKAEIAYEVARVLALESKRDIGDVGHGFGVTDWDGRPSADPYVITYVPRDIVASEHGDGLVLDDFDLRTEQERLEGRAPRPLKDAMAVPGSDVTRERVVVSSWRWGRLPRRDDESFEDGVFEDRERRVHRLSQTWVACASISGCSFCQVRGEGFRPLAHIEGRFIEAVLLMLLQRHRASSLMARLAEVQANAAEEVDRVIELDSEAVGFVVSEQWTMMTDSDRQLDAFLTYLLNTYRIPLLVEEARDQAHRLRENVLMRIGRAEQQAEEERARSTRTLEIAAAVFSFVGLPLSVFLELWVNWNPEVGIDRRLYRLGDWQMGWGSVLIAVLLGSAIIGGLFWWAVARVVAHMARRREGASAGAEPGA